MLTKRKDINEINTRCYKVTAMLRKQINVRFVYVLHVHARIQMLSHPKLYPRVYERKTMSFI